MSQPLYITIGHVSDVLSPIFPRYPAIEMSGSPFYPTLVATQESLDYPGVRRFNPQSSGVQYSTMHTRALTIYILITSTHTLHIIIPQLRSYVSDGILLSDASYTVYRKDGHIGVAVFVKNITLHDPFLCTKCLIIDIFLTRRAAYRCMCFLQLMTYICICSRTD